VTIDHDTETLDSVTVRDRDTMAQDRVKIADLKAYIEEKIAY
jgi:glycyl-tRNA synthetase